MENTNLQVINNAGVLTVDSREVAEMVGKRHSDLLESIKGYIQHLTNGKFRSLDLFIGSTYVDSKGEERPCYLLTKKGCDMVANKMTGEKGVLFSATYINKFYEMEQALKEQQPVFAVPQTLSEALLLAGKLAQEKEEAERLKAIAEAKSDADMRRARTAMQNSGVKSRKINNLEKEKEILEYILNTWVRL